MFKGAESEKFEIGFSNISFEVWLLAHFEKMTMKNLSKSKLKHKLSSYLEEDYVKANYSQLEKISEKVEKAIENSSDISKIDYDRQCTNLGELVLWSDRDTYKVFSFSKVL